MDKPEFRVERGPAATDEPFAVGMAKLLEREGRTIAAAELRRLHEENGRLRIVAEMSTLLLAQRSALLEALKLARPYINPNTPYGYHAEVKADAAIKAVEGEKK